MKNYSLSDAKIGDLVIDSKGDLYSVATNSADLADLYNVGSTSKALPPFRLAGSAQKELSKTEDLRKAPVRKDKKENIENKLKAFNQALNEKTRT